MLDHLLASVIKWWVILVGLLCLASNTWAGTNQQAWVNNSGVTITNGPMTLPVSFPAGAFPAGTYPQPYIGATPVTPYQVNVRNRWADGTQSGTFVSVTSGAEPTVCFTLSGTRVVKEGDLLTIASNSSIANGTYAIAGITSLSPACGYLPAATSTGTATNGTISAPDWGSVAYALVTLPYTLPSVTYDGSGNITGGSETVTYVQASTPCALGNQSSCDAAALTQSGMLAFNSSSWGMEADVSVNNGTATASVNARTMMTAGKWSYLIKGPLLTQVLVEDLTSGAPAYDFGFEDLETTVLTTAINATTLSWPVASCDVTSIVTFPTNLSMEPIHGTGAPEIATATGCSGNAITLSARGVSGSTAQAADIASNIRWLSATPGWSGSWTERPVAVLQGSTGVPKVLTATATSSLFGGYDFFSQISGSAPYTVQDDSEQMTVSSVSSPGSGYGTMNFSNRGINSTTAAAHGGASVIYAQPWFSNWVVAPSNAFKSVHPSFILSFYTPDGTHQWAGVDEQIIMENDWLHKAQDQFFNLTIKTGASVNVTKVNGDRVPLFWGHEFRRRFWDGNAPGGSDCPYGTQTGCGVVIDYGFAGLVASGLIPHFDITTYPLASTEVTAQVNYWCGTVPVDPDGFCSGGTPQQSWYYTQPGQFFVYQPNTGGRGENSHVARWCADYLYAMGPLTTQTAVTQNLKMRRACAGADEGATHWSMMARDDSTGRFFDDLGTLPSFGLPISADAHPTTSSNVNSDWFNGCSGIDCPTFAGITGSINTGNGGRIADSLSLDLAHSGSFPWITYLTSGDYYYLQNMYNWTSMFIRSGAPGTGFDSSHQSWAIMNDLQTRAYAWGWKMLGAVARLAPDFPSESPELRYFQQKLAYNTEAREGWMLINNGYFADSKSTSPYYWGLNTVHNGASNSAITNPLGLWNPILGVSAAINLSTPNAAPCTTGTYPVCTSTQEAGWQNGFGVISVDLTSKYGFNFVKYVRQSMGLGAIAYVSNLSPSFLLAAEYFSSRTSANSGTTPLTGSGSIAYNPRDGTQAAISSWTTVNESFCNDNTSGCPSSGVQVVSSTFNVGSSTINGTNTLSVGQNGHFGLNTSSLPSNFSGRPIPYYVVARTSSTFSLSTTAGGAPISAANSGSGSFIAGTSFSSGTAWDDALGRWNTGPNEDEAYGGIQWAVIASVSDLTGWSAANAVMQAMPNQSTFASFKAWDLSPASSPSCQFSVSSALPRADFGVPYIVPLTTVDCSAPTMANTAGALPSWATLNGGCGAGIICGTPSGSTPTTSSFTIGITDANCTVNQSGPCSQPFTLVTCTPPDITSTSPIPSGVAGSPYSYTFTATGDPTLGWGILINPPGMSLGSTGIFSGTPSSNGLFNLQITSSNACGSQTIYPFQWVVSSSSSGPGVTVENGTLVESSVVH